MSLSKRNSSGSPSLQFIDYGGEKPPMLLLHGVTRCGDDWEPLLPALTSQWRVIALDQRGHGGSERAGSYLVTDYVSDAVKFIRDELATPITIVGHSLGAMVAAAVAAELPHLVSSVVLEDPPFHTMGNRIAGSAWQAQFIGMRDVARSVGSIEAITDALAEIQIPSPSGGFSKRLGELRDRASLAWSAQCLSQLDPEVLTPVIEGRWLDGYDINQTLKSICCPTLLLQGDPTCGGAMTDADAAISTAKPTTSHIRFSGVGHQLHRDRSVEMLQSLQCFMTRSASKLTPTPQEH
jgi:pimeloyl-ACP methyl ester carboxylesterase